MLAVGAIAISVAFRIPFFTFLRSSSQSSLCLRVNINFYFTVSCKLIERIDWQNSLAPATSLEGSDSCRSFLAKFSRFIDGVVANEFNQLVDQCRRLLLIRSCELSFSITSVKPITPRPSARFCRFECIASGIGVLVMSHRLSS